MNVYEALRQMLFDPRVKEAEVFLRRKVAPRAIVQVGKNRVKWADPPSPEEFRTFDNPGDIPAIDRLNREHYDRHWPTIPWKTFKRLRNRDLIVQRDDGSWVPSEEGYRHWEEGWSGSPYRFNRKRSVRKGYKLLIELKRPRYPHVYVDELPQPNHDELMMIRRGKFSQAKQAYTERCKVTSMYLHSFLTEAYQENKDKIVFRRRRGWEERVIRRNRRPQAPAIHEDLA